MCSLGFGNNIVCTVCDLRINCHSDITAEKKYYSLIVMLNMRKILRPAIASQNIPKIVIIILECLYTALRRKKNRSDVAGIAISANTPSIYLTISQLSIGTTMTRHISFGRP